MEIDARQVVRGLLIDGSRRVLLFSVPDGRGERVWALPGGGIDVGEEDAVALARELREELGTDIAHVGRLVAEWELPFRRNGETQRWRTRVYAVESEGRMILPEFARWWSRAELLNSAERFLPTDLPGVLTPLL